MPLASNPTWMKKFNTATGDPDKKVQAKLAKDMKLLYCSGVGELIWAMTMCRPDLVYVAVKLSQANHCPHEHHYHGPRHALKYLYVTKDDGIYFWRSTPRPSKPSPNCLQQQTRPPYDRQWPEFDANILHAYVDSD